MPTSPLCAPHLTSMLRGAEAQRKAFSDGKLLQFCCSKEKVSENSYPVCEFVLEIISSALS